jgi:structural maintenance of chromosome 3 (chondroitin sulfate proteoglycan 6)
MKRLEKDRLGRVTFLPLNRLRIDRANYPDSPDVRPLLSHCIKYDPKVERAMKHVFGKKLLARNVDVASTWSARCKMDAITLDGDLCSRKGALSGGFIDLSRSRLRAQAQQVESREALAKAETEHRNVKQKAEAIDQAATNFMGELQRLEAKHADLNHMLTEADSEVKTLQTKIELHTKQMTQIEKTTIPSFERDVASVTAHIGRLQDEMATELTAALSEDERGMLKCFKTIQTELTAEIETQNETVSQLTVERQRLQSLLTDNLLKRRQELLEDHTTIDEDEMNRRASRGKSSSAAVQEQRREDLIIRQRELDDASRMADEIETRLAEVRQADEAFKAEMIEAKNQFEHLKSSDMKNSQALEDAQQKAEKLLNKVRARMCFGFFCIHDSSLLTPSFNNSTTAIHDCLQS